jgi:hypothetical protein
VKYFYAKNVAAIHTASKSMAEAANSGPTITLANSTTIGR